MPPGSRYVRPQPTMAEQVDLAAVEVALIRMRITAIIAAYGPLLTRRRSDALNYGFLAQGLKLEAVHVIYSLYLASVTLLV